MRAIFLDRDGVICKNRTDHVKNWQEFEFLPEAKSSLATLSRLGLPIIIITNQAIVNRGLVPTAVIDEIHQRMVAEISAYGGRIERVVYCPHRPEDNCDCRKPKPGMLLRVAQEMNIDLSRSYFVGDAATDLIAARQVGCRAFLVLTGRGFQQLSPSLRSVGEQFTITRNLKGAANHILKSELNSADKFEKLPPAFKPAADSTWMQTTPSERHFKNVTVGAGGQGLATPLPSNQNLVTKPINSPMFIK